MGGLIYGLNEGLDKQRALNFAVAAYVEAYIPFQEIII
jgi:hypothetical protein